MSFFPQARLDLRRGELSRNVELVKLVEWWWHRSRVLSHMSVTGPTAAAVTDRNGDDVWL